MATLSRFDDELNELNSRIKDQKAVITNSDLEIKTKEHDIQNHNIEVGKAVSGAAKLEQNNPWILHDKE